MQAGFDEGPTGPVCAGRSQPDPRFARGARLRIRAATPKHFFVVCLGLRCQNSVSVRSRHNLFLTIQIHLRTAVNPESRRPTADRNSTRHDAHGTVPTPSLRLA